MNILIVGLGSIAKKHIKAIDIVHPGAKITALRNTSGREDVEGVNNIYNWDEVPEGLDFIIISNPTKFHKEAILHSLNFGYPLFIEKPLVCDLDDASQISKAMEHTKPLTYVACNLRFHPCLLFLKQYLSEKKPRISEVNVYCGSDLSTWRDGQDYTRSYSAKAELGGGVHLDLIHEVDYCYWLFGKPDEVLSLKRKISSLQINSIDFAAYHLSYPQFTVNISLNYYRKTVKRAIEIVADETILYVDLVKAMAWSDDEQIFSDSNFKMEQTYIDQMDYFVRQINKRQKLMNDFNEAVEVLKIATS